MATLRSTHAKRSADAKHNARNRQKIYGLTKGETRLLAYIALLGDCSYDLTGARGFRFQRRTMDRLISRGMLEHAELRVGDTGTRAAVVLTWLGRAALERHH